ncbi:MAG: aldo/keto reductase [Clostridia bacterium]|nr:aldo/keto reductase [Clostridia bacterium]
MQYRQDKYGNFLSILGFGCMRFERRLGSIEFEKAQELIMTAIDSGVNYFDTAYIYPGSEALLGEVLEKNSARSRVNIATKLPHYLIRSRDGLDKLFAEELRRLRTDHIDYYLMHMLSDVKTWERLKALGIEEWIAEKKKSGEIRQVGFSYHGGSDMFCQLIDSYDWDFCMIQYNYMDEHTQAGKKGLHHANAKGLPVMIMEPLRGGKLVKNIPQEGKRLFDAHPVRHTAAQWAFRWLFDQPEVTCVLSGMNTMDMLLDNLETASCAQAGELTDADQAMLKTVVRAINAKMKVGCTGCGYCMPCPRKVDIPGSFAAYNCAASEGKFWGFIEYMKCTMLRTDATGAGQCIGCGKCEAHCPQAIAIRKELANVKNTYEGAIYRIIRAVIRRFHFF